MLPDPLVHVKKNMAGFNRQVSVEIVLQRDSQESRAEEREQKQQAMQPVALAGLNTRTEVPVAGPGRRVGLRVIRVRR